MEAKANGNGIKVLKIRKNLLSCHSQLLRQHSEQIYTEENSNCLETGSHSADAKRTIEAVKSQEGESLVGCSVWDNPMNDVEIVGRMGLTLAGDHSRPRALSEQIHVVMRGQLLYVSVCVCVWWDGVAIAKLYFKKKT